MEIGNRRPAGFIPLSPFLCHLFGWARDTVGARVPTFRVRSWVSRDAVRCVISAAPRAGCISRLTVAPGFSQPRRHRPGDHPNATPRPFQRGFDWHLGDARPPQETELPRIQESRGIGGPAIRGFPESVAKLVSDGNRARVSSGGLSGAAAFAPSTPDRWTAAAPPKAGRSQPPPIGRCAPSSGTRPTLWPTNR